MSYDIDAEFKRYYTVNTVLPTNSKLLCTFNDNDVTQLSYRENLNQGEWNGHGLSYEEPIEVLPKGKAKSGLIPNLWDPTARIADSRDVAMEGYINSITIDLRKITKKFQVIQRHILYILKVSETRTMRVAAFTHDMQEEANYSNESLMQLQATMDDIKNRRRQNDNVLPGVNLQIKGLRKRQL